jgi:hydrogenase maturation factor HypF (carbamoyltransferase family)
MDLKEGYVKNVKENVMGRAIDMENDIQRIHQRLERIEPALEKVINWISEKETDDDSKKQRKSTSSKKSTKATKKMPDVQPSE